MQRTPKKVVLWKLPNPSIIIQEKKITLNKNKEVCNSWFLMNEEWLSSTEISSKDLIYQPTYLSNTPLKIIANCKQPEKPTFKRDTTKPRILKKISLEPLILFLGNNIHKYVRGICLILSQGRKLISTRRKHFESLKLYPSLKEEIIRSPCLATRIFGQSLEALDMSFYLHLTKRVWLISQRSLTPKLPFLLGLQIHAHFTHEILVSPFTHPYRNLLWILAIFLQTVSGNFKKTGRRQG